MVKQFDCARAYRLIKLASCLNSNSGQPWLVVMRHCAIWGLRNRPANLSRVRDTHLQKSSMQMIGTVNKHEQRIQKRK